MSDLSEKIRTALYTQMHDDLVVSAEAVTAIYYAVAPETASFPFIVFQRVPGAIDYAMNSVRQGERDLWFIKCLSDEDASATKSPHTLNAEILTLAETAIGDTLTITGGTVERVERTADLPEIIETVNDRIIYQHGFQLDIYTAPN